MRNIVIALSILGLVGCSEKVPTVDKTSATIAQQRAQIGTIGAVDYERKSSLLEDFGAFVVGDTVGEQFGGGMGSDMLGILGGAITSEMYEENFADEYTRLSVIVGKKSYPVYVKGHLKLDIGSKVKVSIKNDKIAAISLEK